MSEDVSAYAQARERRLARACSEQGLALRVLPGVTVVPPGDLAPAGGDCYRVFTPYWRRWALAPRRALAPTPRRIARAGGARARAAAGARRARRAARRRPTLPRGGEARGAAASRAGSPRPRRATTGCTTTSPPTAPRASARTCTSAASRRSRWPSARAAATAPSRSCASSAWRDFYAQLLAARPETAQARLPPARPRAGATTRPRCRPGRRVAPATRSSTPACASSRARASCTTARGCSRPRS